MFQTPGKVGMQDREVLVTDPQQYGRKTLAASTDFTYMDKKCAAGTYKMNLDFSEAPNNTAASPLRASNPYGLNNNNELAVGN